MRIFGNGLTVVEDSLLCPKLFERYLRGVSASRKFMIDSAPGNLVSFEDGCATVMGMWG